MKSYELLRSLFDKFNAQKMAGHLGLSKSLVYKWAEPPVGESGSGSINPLERVAEILRYTGDTRIAQWVCQQAGGFFIKNPKTTHPHPDYLVPATNQIVQEFADLLAVIATAAGDNHISAAEAKIIRARWEELKTVTEGFVRCCENGNFRPLKRGLILPGTTKLD